MVADDQQRPRRRQVLATHDVEVGDHGKDEPGDTLYERSEDPAPWVSVVWIGGNHAFDCNPRPRDVKPWLDKNLAPHYNAVAGQRIVRRQERGPVPPQEAAFGL